MEGKTGLDFNQRFKDILSQRDKIRILEDKWRPSAVLIPIYCSQGQEYIIFTKRTTLVHYHKGEISFPGGGFHKEDVQLVSTALRETREEIGLDPQDVNILGELNDQMTKGSHYIITPFVGAIPAEYQFKLSAFEIDQIIQVPVPALLDKNIRKDGAETFGGKEL